MWVKVRDYSRPAVVAPSVRMAASEALSARISNAIRNVPDFPKPGAICFMDLMGDITR